jgi:hypothetical protein
LMFCAYRINILIDFLDKYIHDSTKNLSMCLGFLMCSEIRW